MSLQAEAVVKELKVNDSLCCIRKAFYGDSEIFSYCDPDFRSTSFDELAKMIYTKLLEHQSIFNTSFLVVSDEESMIGYFFAAKKPNLLISFGVCVERRNADSLNTFFRSIMNFFNGESFDSLLFERNTRAISFMIKNGMTQTGKFENLIKMSSCQQED